MIHLWPGSESVQECTLFAWNYANFTKNGLYMPKILASLSWGEDFPLSIPHFIVAFGHSIHPLSSPIQIYLRLSLGFPGHWRTLQIPTCASAPMAVIQPLWKTIEHNVMKPRYFNDRHIYFVSHAVKQYENFVLWNKDFRMRYSLTSD